MHPVRRLIKSALFLSIRMGLDLSRPSVERVQDFCSLRRLLLRLKINCVLDVGANRGQFAHHLRQIGFTGHIVSFEPLPSEFALLSQSFKTDTRWRGLQLALGEHDGSVEINYIPDSSVMSSMLDLVHPPPNLQRLPIEVRRLDGLFPQLVTGLDNPRVLLKLDTQGYDLQVFRGAQGCLDQITGLYAELTVTRNYEQAPDYHEALETYERAGYDLMGLSVNSLSPTGGVHEFNCLMSRT
jgi:FkbM family methyltransferase